MRTIKFRGKDLETNEWLYGNIQVPKYPFDKYFMWDNNHNQREVKPETIGQFTRLQDKNGVEIYEGDIIGNKEIGCGYEIFYDKEIASFRIRGSEEFENFRINKHWIKEYKREVIGNIHDNPELLKGE